MSAILNYPDLKDERLIELHLAGDAGAFRQIVERHQGMVCALGVSACGDVGRSEDLAQEVFVTAWRKLPELRERAKLRGWLAGITRNLIANSFRREQRIPTAQAQALSAETPADGESPRERAIGADEAALMWNTLAEMPESYREPMVLFYREHRSVPAVAAALEISEEAVRQRLARGRAMLSERMAAIVEETLERTGPTRAFSGAVFAALPVGVGAFGASAAKAGAVGKGALTASGVGAAVAKGGLGVKLLAVVGALPMLLSMLPGALDFRMRYDAAKTPEARRLLTRAHVVMHAGIAVGIVGALVWAWMFHGLTLTQEHPWIYVVGLVLLSTVPPLAGSAWSRRQFRRAAVAGQTGEVAEVANSGMEGPGFEYRSERCLLGLPLVHVRTGRKGKGFRSPVKAWFAIGDVAMGVLFAGGGFALAPVSVGGITLGLLSSGGIALGVVALGGIAIGALAIGGTAVGGLVFGGMAAGVMGKGGLTFTHFASGESFNQMAGILVGISVVTWGLAWLPPLVFIGWHMWRRRELR